MRVVLFKFLAVFLFSCQQLIGQGLIESGLTIDTLTTSGFTVSWKNAVVAESYLKYGYTRALELGTLSAGLTESPTVTISNAGSAQLFYVQAETVLGNNSEQTDTIALMTQSLSSGEIQVLFNLSVDSTYALPNNQAISVGQNLDDSLVAYINRASTSIDATFYNSTTSSSISSLAIALNDAHQRGVNVRVIYNESTSNGAIAQLDPSIPILESPPQDFENDRGIMHHKFFIFDADNVNHSYVWTGSTNMTPQQVNTDANHVVIIQDQSIAKTFELEFNEMWGGSGNQPDLALSKFGKDKIDDTPHLFFVGGKKVQIFFSPSDKVQDRLLACINNTEKELFINTMLITRNEFVEAIEERYENNVNIGVLVNSEDQTSVFESLKEVLHGRLAEYSSQEGMLHHKSMIGDVTIPNAFSVTGSHNWSGSANRINDENTVIIYDKLIANQFFQEYMARFKPMVSAVIARPDTVRFSSSDIELIPVSENDDYYFTAKPKVEIIELPKHGIANGSAYGFVSYLKNEDFIGEDSLAYQLCIESISDFCDTAWVYISNEEELSLAQLNTEDNISIFPNPTSDLLYINTKNNIGNSLKIVTPTGKYIYKSVITKDLEVLPIRELGWEKGVYIAVIERVETFLVKRFIVN